jgi:hypothetical protein
MKWSPWTTILTFYQNNKDPETIKITKPSTCMLQISPRVHVTCKNPKTPLFKVGNRKTWQPLPSFSFTAKQTGSDKEAEKREKEKRHARHKTCFYFFPLLTLQIYLIHMRAPLFHCSRVSS